MYIDFKYNEPLLVLLGMVRTFPKYKLLTLDRGQFGKQALLRTVVLGLLFLLFFDPIVTKCYITCSLHALYPIVLWWYSKHATIHLWLFSPVKEVIHVFLKYMSSKTPESHFKNLFHGVNSNKNYCFTQTQEETNWIIKIKTCQWGDISKKYNYKD